MPDLTIQITDQEYAVLQQIAEEDALAIADEMRRALRLLQLYHRGHLAMPPGDSPGCGGDD